MAFFAFVIMKSSSWSNFFGFDTHQTKDKKQASRLINPSPLPV
jgi:hypothetical protein